MGKRKTQDILPEQPMTSEEQTHELASTLWKIADSLRGNIDASQFKDYILGIIFYRFLSERMVEYLDNRLKNDGTTYLEAAKDHKHNKAIADILGNSADTVGFEPSFYGLVKYTAITELGYFIEPEYLFSRLYEKALIRESRQENADKFSVDNIGTALKNLVNSTEGRPSAPAFSGLFDEVLNFGRISKDVKEQSNKMARVIIEIGKLSFNMQDAKIDILGTAYMELIGTFASNSGRKAGEFFTPICASKLLARLATVGLQEVKYVCDPAAGSGSLLLQVREALPLRKVGRFYGQELLASTYNLFRMNLLLHGVSYEDFTAFNDDTLNNDHFYESLHPNSNDEEERKLKKPLTFTVQVANPPFSANWTPKADLGKDSRYKLLGGLPPTQYGEMGFVQHMVHHMDDDGRIAVLLPHGVTTRGVEYNIRKSLVDKNYIDAIISLPKNMFHTTTSAVIVMVLRKNRNGNADNILFIDASKDFTKGKSKNYLTDEQISKTVQSYIDRKDIEGYSAMIPLSTIIAHDYNLSVTRYISKSEEVNINILEKRKELAELNQRIASADTRLQNWFAQLGL